MIILGIDPGTSIVGYALLQKNDGKIHLIEADAIKPDPKLPQGGKLAYLCAKLRHIAAIHSPEILAIEKLYFFKNNKTVLTVSEAKGAILLTATDLNLKIFEYTPLEVKMAFTGYGRADKKQVRFMIKNILKLESVPSLDDITDAMAVAITCFNTINFNNRFKDL